MPLYQIADLAVDSSIALPCVPRARGQVAAWKFIVRRHTAQPTCSAWYHHERAPHGTRWRSLGRADNDHVINFWRRASFLVSFDGRRISCYPRESTTLETIRQLLIAHVMPLVFAEQGTLPLHASVVHTAQGALAFVAQTGAGKSTIALALGARGCPILADDCALVEVGDGVCRVRPLDVGLRLRPETLQMFRRSTRSPNDSPQTGVDKRRVALPALGMKIHSRSEPVHRVYLLEPSRGAARPTIEPVSRPDAVVALMISSFQLGMDEPARLRCGFEMLSTLVAQVPVLRLFIPSGLRHLPAVVNAVLTNAADERSAL